MNTRAVDLIELLEIRRLMTQFHTGSILYIEGTSRSDTIRIDAIPHRAGVEDQFSFTQTVSKTLVDQGQYKLSEISQIIVRASATNDRLRIDPNVTIPVGFVPDDTAGVTLDNGALAVQGGKGTDVIRVYRNRGQVNDITVVLNGQQTQYSSKFAKALLIIGNRGDDDIAVAKVNLPNLVFGGDGNDSIGGGGENDYFSGDLGNDTLRGGAGNDTLFGLAEADLIDGGDGDDNITSQGAATVLGGNGDDSIFINAGGSVQFTGGPGHDHMGATGRLNTQIFTDFDTRKDTYLQIH